MGKNFVRAVWGRDKCHGWKKIHLRGEFFPYPPPPSTHTYLWARLFCRGNWERGRPRSLANQLSRVQLLSLNKNMCGFLCVLTPPPPIS